MTSATAPSAQLSRAPRAPEGLHLGWVLVLVLAVVLPTVGLLASALFGSALLLIPAALVAGDAAVTLTLWV